MCFGKILQRAEETLKSSNYLITHKNNETTSAPNSEISFAHLLRTQLVGFEIDQRPLVRLHCSVFGVGDKGGMICP